jgi:LacI family transcriptional regulator
LQIDAAQLASGEANRLLREQDAHGVILLPTAGEPDFSAIDWSALAGVYMDYALKSPLLNLVYTDHYRSLIMALNELRALGYVRPGLIQKEAASARLHYRWAAAMRAFQCHCLDVEAIDPLVIPTLTQAAFTRWFKRTKPDVVLAHDVRVIDWMEECGAQVPKTHGFVCLNIAMTDRRCAGLDQQPEALGTRGAEIVIAQLQRNERGIPVEAAATTMPARWIAGPTIRPALLRTVATAAASHRPNPAVALNSA